MKMEAVNEALVAFRGEGVAEAREGSRARDRVRSRAPDGSESPVNTQAAESVNQDRSRTLGKEEVTVKLDALQKQLADNGVELKFKLREESGDIQVEVLDPESDKVLRKLPPDELIKLSASLEAQAGGFLDRVS